MALAPPASSLAAEDAATISRVLQRDPVLIAVPAATAHRRSAPTFAQGFAGYVVELADV